MRKYTLLLAVAALATMIMPDARAATVTITPEMEATAVINSSPNNNYASDLRPVAEAYWSSSYGGWVFRNALFKFNLPADLTGATINSATFSVYGWNSWINSGYQVGCFRLTEPWTESGATWNMRDGANAWSIPGGTYTTAGGAIFTPFGGVAGVASMDSINVTSIVQSWAMGQPNYGFALVPQYSVQAGSVYYNSRRISWETTRQLTLTIDYTPGMLYEQEAPCVADTTLDNGFADWNLGNDTQASNICKYISDSQGYNYWLYNNSLLKFDLSQLSDLPDGAHVQAASIRLHCTGAWTWGSGHQVVAYPLTQDWNEYEATWTNATASAPWTTPAYAVEYGWSSSLTPASILIAPAGSGTKTEAFKVTNEFTGAATGVSMDLDVTPIVRAWADGMPNYGILLGSKSGSGSYGVFWSTREDTDVNKQPVLSVIYSAVSRPTYGFTDLNSSASSFEDAFDINNSGAIVGQVSSDSGATVRGYLWVGSNATQLPTLGGTETSPYGINANGKIVGRAKTGSVYHAFFWQGGSSLTDLGALVSGGSSAAWDANDAGVVSGYGSIAGGAYRGAGWTGTTPQQLATLGGTNSYAYDINGSNVAVGDADLSGGTYHACKWVSSTPTDLGTLGGNNSTAIAINEAGKVVGYSDTTAGTVHAFVCTGTTISDLGTLGGYDSEAYDINTGGVVVGRARNDAGQWSACAWINGSITNLNWRLPSGSAWHLDIAYGINDQGQIVGTATDTSTGKQHAFVLSNTALNVTQYTLGELSDLEDGTDVRLVGVEITKDTGSAFYIENDLRTIGMRVTEPSAANYTAGYKATIVGTLQTNDNGERYIDATLVDATAGSVTIKPLGLVNKAVAGGNASSQVGSSNGTGLNNVGLLVKVWGKPSLIVGTSNSFALDDGSASGLTVVLPNGANHGWSTAPSYVTVDGVVGLKYDDSADTYSPVIYVSGMSDVHQ
ncbi:DNRLRE domain-containing protein [bacterium]|nr:DNRLRE domain-containing protein [bacterium]